MPPHTRETIGKGSAGRGTRKKKPRGEKAPIIDTPNPVFPEEQRVQQELDQVWMQYEEAYAEAT